MMSKPDDKLFLSIEISTQQAKVIIINDGWKVVYEDAVIFDTDLPQSQYKTKSGVTYHEDGKTITAPVLMWVEAVDMILERMKQKCVDFSKISSVSGAAQQHGSVYWRYSSEKLLANLDSKLPMREQLKDAFTILDSPIWMDGSTEEECREIEEKMGGGEKLSLITGCRAFHRITANQIKKIYKHHHQDYLETERISLVSSFACSLLVGRYANIDLSDGSAMNLMHLKKREWSERCLQAYGMDDLATKLGSPVPSGKCLGNISPYLVARYGFDQKCKVKAFTGDNPASLIGMKACTRDAVISLGTSDTLSFSMDEYCSTPCMGGLVMINPLNPAIYMIMLCFKNGSLTREKFKDSCGCGGSWRKFDEALEKGVPGNHGNIGIYYDFPEIHPPVQGVMRLNSANMVMTSFEPEVEIRALIEGQMIIKKLHALKMGINLDGVKRILATGGASASKPILQIIADVFDKPVVTKDIKNSACLGGAYMAKFGFKDPDNDGGGGNDNDNKSGADDEFFGNNDGDDDNVNSIFPNKDAVKVYKEALSRYENLEEEIVNKFRQQQ